jgi:CDP-diacylglycerol--serine O-phosphatidyltransferase
MVSNIKYFSLKDPDLFKRQPFMMLVVAIMLLIVIVAQPEIMLFIIGMTYLASGPIGYLYHRRRKKTGEKPAAAD